MVHVPYFLQNRTCARLDSSQEEEEESVTRGGRGNWRGNKMGGDFIQAQFLQSAAHRRCLADPHGGIIGEASTICCQKEEFIQNRTCESVKIPNEIGTTYCQTGQDQHTVAGGGVVYDEMHSSCAIFCSGQNIPWQLSNLIIVGKFFL